MNDLPLLEPIPVLPLRDIIVFPKMIVPLFVGRSKTVKALEYAVKNGNRILLLTQKNIDVEDPKEADLYKVGTCAKILQMLKLPDGTLKILVEAEERVSVHSFVKNASFYKAHYEIFKSDDKSDKNMVLEERSALLRVILRAFDEYVKLNKQIAPETIVAIEKIKPMGQLADVICGHLAMAITEKQAVLEEKDVLKRLELIHAQLTKSIKSLEVETVIRDRVKKQMEKNQREYYLNEQAKAIQKELSTVEGAGDEFEMLEKKIKNTKFTKAAREKLESELKKLRSMGSMSSEATIVRSYIDWMLDLPWSKPTKTRQDLRKAEKILNADHYGLEKVKERILEYLAVQKRTGKVKGPILCFVGPPGVGKTSLGRSIASATGREYVRISLGGVRDEAEIRGHRRTYIGSMPGKIIQSMKKAKASNPLFLLDEIDKLGSDHRGDPASALLEVLDPEQNNQFNDHYLEVDYDLSDVLFICTSNSLDIPAPLVDRMEVIHLSGYTEDEKLQIAKEYLIAKQLKANGLKKSECSFTDLALLNLIRYYTKEAGVRGLEREIAKIARKITKKIVTQKSKVEKTYKITPKELQTYLGVKKYSFGVAEETHQMGITTGLAWTQVGGELLLIEAVTVPGKGKITYTGKLGDVMKESIEAAQIYVRSHAAEFGIHPLFFDKIDIHVHVPEGATPKDGPSAGVAMMTSIVSVLTSNPVRRDVAMTGEISLRGQVLPIGGLKEKLLAAHRGGIKKVLIPFENEKDLEEMPQNIKKGLEIIPVKKVDEVLKHALLKGITPMKWDQSQFYLDFLEKNAVKH